jgi:hypothetical protein
MTSRIVALTALIALSVPASVAVADASQRVGGEHCVVHVTGTQPDGELTVSEPECYPTFEQAMSAEGVDAWGVGAAGAVDGVTASTFTLGTHYDGAGYSGASTSVVGSDCAGGWLNVSSTWNNRIGSTLNGCPRIRHFDGQNLTGIYQDTVSPGGNLTTLDNRTSSIQYRT